MKPVQIACTGFFVTTLDLSKEQIFIWLVLLSGVVL